MNNTADKKQTTTHQQPKNKRSRLGSTTMCDETCIWPLPYNIISYLSQAWSCSDSCLRDDTVSEPRLKSHGITKNLKPYYSRDTTAAKMVRGEPRCLRVSETGDSEGEEDSVETGTGNRTLVVEHWTLATGN